MSTESGEIALKTTSIEMPDGLGLSLSESVKVFIKIEKDCDQCILFDDYEKMRRAYSSISNWCRNNSPSERPRCRQVEEGWAIWKRKKGEHE